MLKDANLKYFTRISFELLLTKIPQHMNDTDYPSWIIYFHGHHIFRKNVPAVIRNLNF